ncbi:acyl-CoA dehydrogenase [Novosphingobium sp. PC22D]|uniref:acyl-CoA dehydrogenase n=1 Tax=Novosphingobium sp. PC22D TaxID=1962403 RepID=UPI000BEFA84D|nr:acyl-CoA dehydrogenase [Novosphingobium sp. PC22D]PEQ11839.1 acyl-CoA dehydrogenase [Novosphingobium sp. PC22D]
MNFDLTDEQEMVRDNFARFLDEHSSSAKIRKAMEEHGGFDPALWTGLAELGAFAIRVPEEADGMGLGLFDAVVVMEEAGRTLASGPLAEALVAARLLGQLGTETASDELAATIGGETVTALAFHDMAETPMQWIAGGAVAGLIVARRGDDVVLLTVPEGFAKGEDNLATTPIAEIDLSTLDAKVLASGGEAVATFAAGLEEWKLLMAAALSGLGRQALKLAAEYACERKAFDQLIGQFQGVSHPLADRLCDVDGGKLLTWRTIRDIADGKEDAGGNISLSLWQSATAAADAVSQALQTFGGYGLSKEYDIHLYNLRANAWPLVHGDVQQWLAEAGRRFYGGETVSLPDVGETPIEFDIGEEARAVNAEIDAFFETQVTDEEREQFHFSWEGWVPSVHKKLKAADLLFLGNPSLGGRELGPYAKKSARERFNMHGYSNPAISVAEMVGYMMVKFGTDDLKAQVLERVVNGDAITSLGYSEPGCGSDVFAARTRATQAEDGSWRINGTKMWTSGANLSEYVLMLARTNAEVAKHKGLTMFIVPLKAEGVEVQAIHTFMDERTNVTFYDDVHVPDTWRLGPVDGGTKVMSVALELEHGGGFGKVIEDTLEACEEVLRDLKRIDDTHLQVRLARIRAHIGVAEMLEFRSMWAGVEKKPNMAFGPMAKMYSSEVFLEDAREMLQMTAPLSLSKRKGPLNLINQSYRHAHGTRIYGGTSEVHRSMIAERGLGMPRTRA